MLPYVFAHPQYLYLLGIIPPLALWYLWQHTRQQVAVRVSTTAPFRSIKQNLKAISRHLLFVLRLIGCAFLILALARPQLVVSKKMIRSEGIDIMLVLDISGSMFARDFVPNRLEAAKNVAKHFIDNRPNDRIGLVVFSSQAYAASPVTIDHDALKTIVSGIEGGTFETGTAIGLGIGTATNRLQESKSNSRVIILMTDGENNAGDVNPIDAAQLAAAAGIRVYTIGMEPYEHSIDQQQSSTLPQFGPTAEVLLQQIAMVTDGKYYHAMDEKNLASIYKVIDGLEKTKVDVASFNQNAEAFFPFAVIALIAIFLEVLLRYTTYKSIS